MAYATRRSYAGAAPACTLTNAINSSDTSALLTGDVTNWNNTTNGPFYMVIDPGLSTEEKVLVSTRSGSSLSSITRGVDGTTASSHSAGATCYPVFTAVDADQANKVASTLTTKGDLLATDGTVLNRLAVGTNDYVLKADSSATNGVAWGQVAAAGIASDAVTTAKILDANVTAGKLATDSVTTAKIADLNVTGAKLANLTVSTKTASYTLVAADRNTRVVMNSSSSTSITVNTSLFSAGDVVWIHNIGSGTCTVTAGTATVTTSGSLALAQWGGGTLYFTSASAAIFFPAGGGVSFGSASGGTSSSITVGGVGYTLLSFTSTGSLTVSKDGVFDVLLIGGGGGGGTGGEYGYGGGNHQVDGGGGGGGGYITSTIYLTAGTHTITVGAGGAQNTHGEDSTIGAFISGFGGGHGGFPWVVGGYGGSNGGNTGYISSAGPTKSSQGYAGGVGTADLGYSNGTNRGGGGGGAAAVGASGSASGNGGAGVDISTWLGQSSGTTYKAGGGGGGRYAGSAGSGGTGGGGAGGTSGGATAGTANSGGGGGGGYSGAGAGGSGIVYVRFK
jgi:hypothetical protein